MSQLKASDLVVGLNVAYQRGTVFSLATVKEVKNRIKIENEGEERWVTPNSLHGLDKLKPDPAKATYSEALLKALPDKVSEGAKETVSAPVVTDTVKPAASPPPAETVAEPSKAVEKNSSPPTEVATDPVKPDNGANPPKSDKALPKKPPRPAKPKTAIVVTPPPPTTGWSPRLIAVITLILLMLFVGLFLYFNRAQLEHLTITPTTILIK